MMPLSWRIEKFIYALWHAFVVGSWLFWMDSVDHWKLNNWLTDVFGGAGIWIRHALTIYVIWQLAIFFLHISNALTGQFYMYFNHGSLRNFLRTTLIMASGEPPAGPTPYYNINRMIQHRESKMGAVSQSEAANILVKTAMLDAIATGAYQGDNARRAAANLNAKLGAMSQSDGLKFLMNQNS